MHFRGINLVERRVKSWWVVGQGKDSGLKALAQTSTRILWFPLRALRSGQGVGVGSVARGDIYNDALRGFKDRVFGMTALDLVVYVVTMKTRV